MYVKHILCDPLFISKNIFPLTPYAQIGMCVNAVQLIVMDRS